MKETYKEIKTMEFPGMTVRVHSPILDDKERQRRMKLIHNQAANLLKKTGG